MTLFAIMLTWSISESVFQYQLSLLDGELADDESADDDVSLLADCVFDVVHPREDVGQCHLVDSDLLHHCTPNLVAGIVRHVEHKGCGKTKKKAVR